MSVIRTKTRDELRAGNAASEPTASPTAKDIQIALVRWLRWTAKTLAMPNVYVGGSPWEADVITVTSAFYWTEYEIKLTRGDFQSDFSKCICRYARDSPKKHELYTANAEIRHYGKLIPKPKRFFFVAPTELLGSLDIPEYCGVIEYGPTLPSWRVRLVREAEQLPKATQLNQAAIFNLAAKAATRLNMQLDKATK